MFTEEDIASIMEKTELSRTQIVDWQNNVKYRKNQEDRDHFLSEEPNEVCISRTVALPKVALVKGSKIASLF